MMESLSRAPNEAVAEDIRVLKALTNERDWQETESTTLDTTEVIGQELDRDEDGNIDPRLDIPVEEVEHFRTHILKRKYYGTFLKVRQRIDESVVEEALELIKQHIHSAEYAEAHQVFLEMKKTPSVTTPNATVSLSFDAFQTMIKCYCLADDVQNMMATYREMKKANHKPNGQIYQLIVTHHNKHRSRAFTGIADSSTQRYWEYLMKWQFFG